MRSTVLGLIVGALAASAVSVMTESNSAVITACADAKGTLRLPGAQGCDPRRERTISWNQVGPVGPAGPIGPMGPAGAQGPAGAAGATGAQGPQGPPGVQGPAGADGAQGPQGPQGAEGPQGPAGLNGLDGSQGIQGERGPQGPPGPSLPNLAGMATARSLSIAVTDCTQGYNESTLISAAIVLGPGTYRPVFSGSSSVGHAAPTGASFAELQVRNAESMGLYSQYTKQVAGINHEETPFNYFTLTSQQFVNVRTRTATSCGSAAIGGIVYFEKVG